MLKKLKDVGKRGKARIASTYIAQPSGTEKKKRDRSKTATNDLLIGGPVLVNDFSDRQLTLSAPTRPMTRVDIHELVRTQKLEEMKKHRFTPDEVNRCNAEGLTPLHVACSLEHCDLEMVAYLISLGADVNAVDIDGWTPLHAACKHDEVGHIIPLLVSHQADVNRPNKDGTRPLHYFARKFLNKMDILESNAKALEVMLTAGADINATNMHGETPLHSCVMHGDLATLELLINKNADINAVNKLGDNILHYAVMRQRVEMIHKLLRMGFDPTVSTPGGANGSPLDLAKKDSSPAGMEITELLTRPTIEEEEEDVKDTEKKTDIWSLVKAGDYNEIKKLREKNLVTEEELKRRNAAGQCLLHLACNQAEPNREIIDYLITCNPGDINSVDQDGCSPLHYACKKNNDGETIAVLVAKGADVSRSSNDGTKPIHYFARRSLQPETVESNAKALEFLLTYGADINAPNKFGESPLHNAIMQGNFLMLQLLLSKNPDLNLTNNYGENILHYTIIAQKKDMVEKILDLNIDPRVTPATNGTPLQQAKLLAGHPKGKEVYDIVLRKAIALDIAGMSDEEKRDYRRKRVIEELVETERDYANDLGIIIKVYINPLKAFVGIEDSFLTESQLEDIFGNIEEIKMVSDSMNLALQKCQSADPQYFGQVFLSHMDALQKYEKVCVHQQMAGDALQEALNTQKSFKTFCEAGQKHRDCKKLSIDALLIKPFQRITKYPLLLRELLSVTPEDHPDYPDLVKARQKLEVLINIANEKKRVLDNKNLIKKINDNLIYDHDEPIDLCADEDRVFKREALFKMSFNKEKTLKRTLFLFNDLLLICQADKKKYSFLYCIPLSQCIVWDIADGSLEGGKPVKNAFSVIHRVKQLRVVVCTDSLETKKDWMHAMNDCIASGPSSTPKLKRKEISASSGSPLPATTLPPSFKGFGLGRKNSNSSEDIHTNNNGESSPKGNSSEALNSAEKKKGIRLGGTLIGLPLTSLASSSITASVPPSGGTNSGERRVTMAKPEPPSTGPAPSPNSSMGLLGVLRRKTSSGERFKQISEYNKSSALSSAMSDADLSNTHPDNPSGNHLNNSTSPVLRAKSSNTTTTTSHSSSVSFPVGTMSPTSTTPEPAPASAAPSTTTTGTKRRVRALSSYNTAPNRPLPSVPTFAAGSTSESIPDSNSVPIQRSTTNRPPTLKDEGSSGRSLSVSSLTATFDIPTNQQLARALFDFVGDKDAFQIDLNEGDIIHIFEQDHDKGDGWWYGECNNVTGYFPGHYVELL